MGERSPHSGPSSPPGMIEKKLSRDFIPVSSGLWNFHLAVQKAVDQLSQFSAIFGKNWPFFSKTNVMKISFAKISRSLSKNANFWAKIFF
jgi:hypothetical protein